jgi:hypothetical protein
MKINICKEQMNAAADYLWSNPSKEFYTFSSQQKAKDFIFELIKSATSDASIYTGSGGVFVLLAYKEAEEDFECYVEILVDPSRGYMSTSEIKHAAKNLEINYDE